VSGDAEQRQQALTLLSLISDPELKTEAVELCRFARDRARRRGEPELERRAEQVLEKLRRE
jgi:hypothetical protein